MSASRVVPSVHVPLNLEYKLEVLGLAEPPRRASSSTCIRAVKIAMDRGIGADFIRRRSILMKSPPVQLPDDEGRRRVEAFIAGEDSDLRTPRSSSGRTGCQDKSCSLFPCLSTVFHSTAGRWFLHRYAGHAVRWRTDGIRLPHPSPDRRDRYGSTPPEERPDAGPGARAVWLTSPGLVVAPVEVSDEVVECILEVHARALSRERSSPDGRRCGCTGRQSSMAWPADGRTW